MKWSQALLEAAGNSPCKSTVRWVKTQGQERHHQKSKAWFLLLWWKGLLFPSALSCWLGYEVGQYKTYHRAGWGESYKKDKKERNSTTAMFFSATGAQHLWHLPFLTHPSSNSCAVYLKEGKKVTTTNLTFICTHITSTGSMTNLNTDFKEPWNHG